MPSAAEEAGDGGAAAGLTRVGSLCAHVPFHTRLWERIGRLVKVSSAKISVQGK